MCGIVGVVGTPDAASILLEGLKRLEYRGYDSAGIAIQGADKQIIFKEKGKICNLEAAIDWKILAGTCGIGQTIYRFGPTFSGWLAIHAWRTGGVVG